MLSEKWVRHWFVLRNTVLNMYTEEQKEQASPHSLLRKQCLGSSA